ncbi:hypothetical protein F4553_000371 [Allocatelliglobosispora scoriae]|uniref:Choloylglycine hydrolase/NAAA C-terminal domain-containing protein n=1 Tax=Allocatelliglobosispora scoriae TaxID=643052 RepID=A0A841BJN2_9ACTN|nr:linear amide C-N hydrolase [Allocatelliglobosispora scoriae]MBB5866992.1 hypothetical protein [Allocatelliglobosispora scoriae]
MGTVARRIIALAAVVTLGVAGCSEPSEVDAGPSGTASTGTASASRQTPAEAEATLASLKQIDKLPLYEMTYTGDYDELSGIPGPGPTATPFGCSLFVAAGDPQNPLFARNFDWDPNPALVLHTDPPDGYASFSIVDISYLGVSTLTTEADKRKLLNAPLLPFDGMNERGLAVGLAADDLGNAMANPRKRTVGSVRILRLLLDHAATVEEALTLMGSYNLDFDGGPALHYLIADATGRSAVVEFVNGAMTVERGTPPWQVLTNIQLAGANDATRQRDERYRVASGKLTATGGKLDATAALGLLHDVVQSHTRWSVTYGLKTGTITVVSGQRWEKTYDFRLPMAG